MKELLEKARDLVASIEKYEREHRSQQNSMVQLSELKPGDVFKNDIGEFIVLDQLDGQTKVITKGFYKEDVVFDGDVTDYKESKLRTLHEEEILPYFESVFGEENLVEHEVDLTTVDMQDKFGKLMCKVRPITFDEARKYNELLVNKDLSDWYWTCTSWSTEERGWKYPVAIVSRSGGIDYDGCNGNNGVRPLCILNSSLFVSGEK